MYFIQIQSLETDFIVPLGAKLDMESHNIPVNLLALEL